MTNEDFLVFGALLAAGVLVVWGGCRAHAWSRSALGRPMGPVNYDFSKSWASSITVVGALLGTVLSANGIVPLHTQYLPSRTYSALNLLFGIVVVLGPFIYRSTSAPEAVTTAQGLPDTEYHGKVFGFLIATLLTLWGVVGELATIFLLFAELQESRGVIIVFFMLFASSGVLILVYALRSIPAVIEAQAQHAHRATAVERSMVAAGVQLPGNVPVSRQSWSLL